MEIKQDVQQHNLAENQNQQSKIFCTAPFFHYYYKGSRFKSRMLPCCESRMPDMPGQTFEEYWRSDFLKDVRQSMLDGKKHDICTRCIDVETNGGFSARKHYNNIVGKLEKLIDNKLEYSVETGTQYDTPLAIDYRGSNLCNLKCRMCHPGSSSEIAKEIVRHQKKYESFGFGDAKYGLYKDNKEPNKFIETLPLENIRRMKILGGEPLMQEDVYIALEKIKKFPHAKDVLISFTTNATNFPERFINLIGQYRKFLLRVSLDGVGDVYEYVRTNGNWKQVLDNCININTHGFTANQIGLGFSFVIQFYNIFSIKEILTFCAEWENKQYKIWDMPIFFSTIEQDHLSTLLLTDEDRNFVNDQINEFDEEYPNKEYTQVIREIVNNFDINRKLHKKTALKLMKDYTLMQDKLRKTDLTSLNQRFKKYL